MERKGNRDILRWLAREEIARLNTRLANKGVHVYGIRTIEKTLEERFLEMTESDRID
ncbi:hypothetical protein ACFQ49_06060 [Kroppenstedtia eburnea]|uniref:hypothetical protein n=1 Tax=Kroppenstedtia eburnea TaxID=714067 RepID=UPI001F2F1934|nr:hypothetical protein [Kroppenstedtia eburnea]